MTPGQPPRVRITTSLRQDLGQAGFSRTGMVILLTALHVWLPAIAAQIRHGNRVPGRPNTFSYDCVLRDQGRVRYLRVTIGDAGWPAELWAVSVTITDGGSVP
jgi:hypothetical protein